MEAITRAYHKLFGEKSNATPRQMAAGIIAAFDRNKIGEPLAQQALLAICASDSACIGPDTARRAKSLAIEMGYFSGEPNQDQLERLYHAACEA